MLIGNTFNRKCEKILHSAAMLSDYEEGKKVSVVNLAEKLKLDRVEIRQSFQYLMDLEFIQAESIGGPYLYGHISLTKKGLLKEKRLRGK